MKVKVTKLLFSGSGDGVPEPCGLDGHESPCGDRGPDCPSASIPLGGEGAQKRGGDLKSLLLGSCSNSSKCISPSRLSNTGEGDAMSTGDEAVS